MKTYSHLIGALGVAELRGDALGTPAFLAGSVAPDVPLALITGGYVTYHRHVTRLNHKYCGPDYRRQYLENRWWIVGHNLLHAPLIVTLLALAGLLLGRDRLLWFALGCGLHTLADLPTHRDDGPLLFFPLDWQTRLHSKISYWDPDHGGRWFSRLELLGDLLVVLWLARRRF